MSFDTFPMAMSEAINLGDMHREGGVGAGTFFSSPFYLYHFLAYAQARAMFP